MILVLVLIRALILALILVRVSSSCSCDDFCAHCPHPFRRQISGECGAPVSDPMEWEESYDVGNGDTPPDEGR